MKLKSSFRYPRFSRLAPTADHYANAGAKFLIHNRLLAYTEVIRSPTDPDREATNKNQRGYFPGMSLVYQDHGNTIGNIGLFRSALATRYNASEVVIHYEKVLPYVQSNQAQPLPSWGSTIGTLKAQAAKLIVISFYEQGLVGFFCEIYNQKFFAAQGHRVTWILIGYWFLPTFIADGAHLTECTAAQIEEAMEGLVASGNMDWTPFDAQGNERKFTYTKESIKTLKQEYDTECMKHPKVSLDKPGCELHRTIAPFSYDFTFAIGASLDRWLRSKAPLILGQRMMLLESRAFRGSGSGMANVTTSWELANQFLDTEFEGVTGYVKLHANGDRDGNAAYYQIQRGKGGVRVGYDVGGPFTAAVFEQSLYYGKVPAPSLIRNASGTVTPQLPMVDVDCYFDPARDSSTHVVDPLEFARVLEVNVSVCAVGGQSRPQCLRLPPLECGPGREEDPLTNTCVSCKPGFYKSANMKNACKFVGIGSTNNANHSATVPCPAGTYSNQTKTLLSSANDGDVFLGCQACPGGIAALEGSAACSNCLPGTFARPQSAQCTDCPRTFFAESEKSSECMRCEAGTYADRGTAKCDICDVGTYAAAGQSQCTKCPAGTFAKKKKSQQCELCAIAHFQDQLGGKECIKCPATMITKERGSSRGT